jgi:hypothetical protein
MLLRLLIHASSDCYHLYDPFARRTLNISIASLTIRKFLHRITVH